MNKNLGCGTAVFLIVVFAMVSQNLDQVQTAFFVGILVAVGVAVAILINRGKKSADIEKLTRLKNNLEVIAADLHPIELADLSLKKDEVAYFHLPQVNLIEYRSTGSSYVGGSQGVSVRIMKGVSYRVGQTRGQLVKNPEQLTIVDVGSATFTNKRILFAGPKLNREWDFEKLVNAEPSANGVSINIAVSNRQKNSGLYMADETRVLVAFTQVSGLLKSKTSRANFMLFGSLPLIFYTSALGILDVERDAPGTHISTFTQALWWALTTIATVGYGDIYPVTESGKLIAAFLLFVGIGSMSLITANVAAWFVNNIAAKDSPS